MSRVLLYLPTAGSRVEGAFTGAPKRLLSLATALADLQVAATLCTESHTPLFCKASERSLHPLDYRLPRIFTTRGGHVFKKNPIVQCKVFWGAIVQTLRFAKLVRRERFEVVWLRGSKGILLGGLGAKMGGAKIVWDIDYEPPSTGIISLIHKFGLRISSKVVFQYKGCAERVFGQRLSSRYTEKMIALTPGIELHQLEACMPAKQPLNERDSFTLLHAGTLCERKNQMFTLQLVARFLRKHPHTPLKVLFAGGVFDQSYADKMNVYIEQEGLGEVVSLLGWRDDLPALMASATGLIMPSFDEGVPNTAQEAMFLGVPCMTSTAGGLKEIISHQETGWVQDLADEHEWLCSLEEAVFDLVKRAEVSAKAQLFAQENFTTSAWGAKYADLLRDVK